MTQPKRRWKDRPLNAEVLVGRFEEQTTSELRRNAKGVIERLRDEGCNTCWKLDPDKAEQWHRYCTVLWEIIHALDAQKNLQNSGLTKVLREFIQEYEHTSYRLRQMLYGYDASDTKGDQESLQKLEFWLTLVYRCATYAIVSTWIEDKDRELSTEITMKFDLNVGTVSTTQTTTMHRDMRIPPEYRKASKPLL